MSYSPWFDLKDPTRLWKFNAKLYCFWRGVIHQREVSPRIGEDSESLRVEMTVVNWSGSAVKQSNDQCSNAKGDRD
jgi:hypothetical protein